MKYLYEVQSTWTKYKVLGRSTKYLDEVQSTKYLDDVLELGNAVFNVIQSNLECSAVSGCPTGKHHHYD